jgi:hypothetical protein
MGHTKLREVASDVGHTSHARPDHVIPCGAIQRLRGVLETGVRTRSQLVRFALEGSFAAQQKP